MLFVFFIFVLFFSLTALRYLLCMTNCQSTVQLQGENSHQKIPYLLVKIFQPCIYLSFQYVKYT